MCLQAGPGLGSMSEILRKVYTPEGTFTGRALVLASGAMGRTASISVKLSSSVGSELLRYLRCSLP